MKGVIILPKYLEKLWTPKAGLDFNNILSSVYEVKPDSQQIVRVSGSPPYYKKAMDSISYNITTLREFEKWISGSVKEIYAQKASRLLEKRYVYEAPEIGEESLEKGVVILSKSIKYDIRRYAEQLQKAGYATDPGYAEKIKQIMGNQLFNASESRMSGAAHRLSVMPGGR